MHVAYLPEPGDILIFSGRGLRSRLIRLGTCSPYSHVGIVAHVTPASLLFMPTKRAVPQASWERWRPRDMLFESTVWDDIPCEITGKSVRGVQAHDVLPRVGMYPGRVWVMRCRLAVHEWVSAQINPLTQACLNRLGVEYDHPGAQLAGTRLLKRLLPWRTKDRSTQFCVENTGEILRRVLPEYTAGLRPGELTPGQFVAWAIASGLYERPVRVK